MNATLIWYGALPTLPIWAAQGWWARHRAVKLPPAAGPTQGRVGDGTHRARLAVLGESPVAGVGVENHQQGLTGQIATALAAQTGARIDWLAVGENGIRLAACRQTLAKQAMAWQPDYLVIVLGVNDTTGLTPRQHWRREFQGLLQDMQPQLRRATLCAGVPPMQKFTAVPQPLRQIVGARARLLDGDLQRLCAHSPRTDHLALSQRLAADDLCRDGYHPSASGCRRWGEQLAAKLLQISAP